MQNEKEIRYFSMFTGVGGFELGIEGASTLPRRNKSNDNCDEHEQECTRTTSVNLPKTEGNKSGRDENSGSMSEQVGLASKQFTCVGFSENNKYASELLAKRFPTVKNYGDCTKINPDELPDFDFLCGGFPCQSFSIAGKRKGFNDTRGTMFFEVARILEVKRPKTILLENVKGLLNHEKGKTFSVILETLDELGYETQWMVLNSKFFGVPQNRERVFIIGNLRGERRPEILPFGQDCTETYFNEALQPQANTLTATCYKGSQSDGMTCISYARTDKSQHSRVYNTDGIAPTLAGASKLSGDCTPKIVASRGRNPMNPSDRTVGNPTVQRLEENSEGISNNLTSVQKDNMVLEDTKIRRLTPLECERLQGFPDNWTEEGKVLLNLEMEDIRLMSNTQRYKMMGNAVTVNVIHKIMDKFKEVMENV